MAPVGLAFAVLQATGKVSDLGFTLSARVLPIVGFLLVGGVLADRLRRDLLVLTAELGSALAQGATAALVLTGHVTVVRLMVLQAVAGTAAAFLFPALTGAVPQTVRPEQRQAANAILGLVRNATLVLGAPLGGLLASTVGPGWALVADAVSYLGSALCWTAVRLPPSRLERADSFLTELREGWTEFRSRTWLWAIVVQFAILVALGEAAFDVLAPVVSQQHYGGASLYAGVLALEACGSVGAGLALVRLRVRRPLLAGSVGMLAFAPELGALAVHGPVWTLLVLAAVAGAGTQVFGVLWNTVMQEQIPPEKLSRVSAFDAFGSIGMLPVGLALMGFLAAGIGVSLALLVGAAGVVVPTLLVLLVPDVRRMRSRPHAPPASVTMPDTAVVAYDAHDPQPR